MPRAATEPSCLLVTITARWTATGVAFQRWVARSVARQVGKEVERACSPLLGQQEQGPIACATLTDANPLRQSFFDGVGAYDHISQSAMFSKLLRISQLRGLMSFAIGKTTKESGMRSGKAKAR